MKRGKNKSRLDVGFDKTILLPDFSNLHFREWGGKKIKTGRKAMKTYPVLFRFSAEKGTKVTWKNIFLRIEKLEISPCNKISW